MYCSSCGSAVPQNLSYCNHCGAKVSGAKADDIAQPSESFPESLVWAIVSVTVGGLGVIMILLAVMKEVFSKELIAAFMLLSFLLLFAAESVFIWLLLRRKRDAKEIDDTARRKEQATKDLSAAQAQAFPEPGVSVSEHTTRTLEPAYSERKTE